MDRFKIEGYWEFETLNDHIKQIEEFYKNSHLNSVVFDFSKLDKIDSSGIILVIKYIFLFREKNIEVKIENISDKYKSMLELYKQNYTHQENNNGSKKNA